MAKQHLSIHDSDVRCEPASNEYRPHPLISIESLGSQRYPGTYEFLPLHNIRAGDEISLSNRAAVLGAGPDFSSASLKETFETAGAGLDFYKMQFELKDHAVVHAACLNEKNAVPVTIMPFPGSSAMVTLSFLSMEQLRALTDAKADCDLLLLKDPLEVSPGSPGVRALIHANVWGALSDGRGHPFGVENQKPLKKISGFDAFRRVANLLGEKYPVMESKTAEERLLMGNSLTQAWLGIPLWKFPLTEATAIKLASVRERAEDGGFPISPV